MIGRSVLITVAIIAVILVSLVPPIAADTRTTVFYPSSYLDGSGDVRDVLAGDADWWAPYDSTGRVGVTAKCAALGAAHAWAYRYLAYKAAATGLATIEVTIEYTGGGYTAGTGWSVLNTLLWVDVWRPPTTQPGLDFVEGSVSVLIPGESWNDILQSAYDALDTKLAQYEGNPSVVHTHTMRKSFQFEQNRWYVIAAGLDAAVTGCLGGAGIKMMGKVKSITVTEYEAPQALPDWTIALYPDALNLLRDGSATSTITLASLNQFEGAVYFSSPEYPAADIDVSINPTSVHLSSGGTVTAKLSVSAGSHALTGTWTFKITATGGGETHSADITIIVPRRA